MAKDDGWKPKNTGEQFGAITEHGEYVPPRSAKLPKVPNRLMDSKDAVTRRIGAYMYSAPAWVPNDMAVFGGILLGLNMARLGANVNEVIANIRACSKGGGNSSLDAELFDMADAVANKILFGIDPRDFNGPVN